jgi:L-gulonate 5-dehydrogenase
MYVTKKELNVVGSRLSCNKFPEVIERFEKGIIDPSKIVSHTLSYEEVEKGMKILTETPEEAGKIVIEFK